MVDHDPRPIDLEELGVDLGAETGCAQSQNTVPAILCNKQGRMRWTLPGNTPEENEQLATRNMQALFLAKYPEFDHLYPRYNKGQIEATKLLEAKQWILTRVGKERDFSKTFSETPRDRSTVPYFEGSYIIALGKTFNSWGIRVEMTDLLSVLDNSMKNSTTEEVVLVLQERFLGEYPEFVSLFLTDGNKAVEAKQEEGRRFILERIGNRKQFRTVIGGGRGITSHFKGKNKAIEALLASWGIPLPIRTLTAGRDGLWKGRTEEECVGIMQSIWLDIFPEFNQLFPRQEDGKIESQKRAEAARYILDRVSKGDEFVKIFGHCASDSRTIPYFRGFVMALEKTFRPWGIELQVKEFGNSKRDNDGKNVKSAVKRLHWRGKSEEGVISDLLTIFYERFPQIKNLLDKCSSGQTSFSEIENFIFTQIGTVQKFLLVFPVTVLFKQNVPYFDGSYKIAIEKITNAIACKIGMKREEEHLNSLEVLLVEYEEMLLAGQIMSYEAFMNMKGRKK